MKFAWSHSALNMFENCPRKYAEVKVYKNYKETFSGAADYGKTAHKFFEERVGSGAKLPMDLQHHEGYIARLCALPGEKYVEQRLALTRDMQPTGFFDSDVWVRAVVDLLILNGDKCLVIDYKFGKKTKGFDQINLATAVVASYHPHLTKFSGRYYWAKEKDETVKMATRGTVLGVWNSVNPRVQAMEDAIATDRFPEKPSGLCKQYCPVKSCKYHGKGI